MAPPEGRLGFWKTCFPGRDAHRDRVRFVLVGDPKLPFEPSDRHALQLSERDRLDLAAPFGGIGGTALQVQHRAYIGPELETHILIEHFANVHSVSDRLESA